MKKLTIVIITILLALGYNAEASIYSTLKGTVKLPDGKPAVGTTVQVIGTVKGAFVKGDGSFIITNIEAGSYEVRFSFTGLQEQIIKVNLSADQTRELNVKLKESSVKTEEVVVTADKTMVTATAVGVTRGFAKEDLETVSTNNVNSIVTLSAGVMASGNGYTVRGSRANQTQMRVDGVEISDPFSGGLSMGMAYTPTTSQSAIGEVQVKTGGFGAEYGSALGGVVNSTVKTGKTDRIAGFFNYRTDMPYFNGYSPSNIRLVKQDGNLKIQNYGEGYKYQGAIQDQFEFGIDGPIPYLNNSTFALSTNNRFEEYTGNSYKVLDPAGNNLGQLPNQSAWVKNITGKLNFQITPETKVIVGGQWGQSNIQNSSWGWLYANSPGMFISRDANFNATDTVMRNVPENVYKQGGSELTTVNGYVTLNQVISDVSYFEVSAKYYLNTQSSGRMLDYDTPSYFSGWDFLEPVDNVTLSNGAVMVDENGNSHIPNQIHDYYEGTEIQNQKTADGFQTMAIPVRNIYSGYFENLPSSRGTANPYGVNNQFINHSTAGYTFQKGTYFQVDGNYNNELTSGSFTHKIRTGFEVRLNDMNRHANSSPNVSSPVGKDIYSDLWGGNIYELNPIAKAETSKPRTPTTIALYVEDQIVYKDIIFSPSLRMDYFDPASKYRLVNNVDYFIKIQEINNPNLFADAKPRIMFSPRLNVSFPITPDKRQFITMNYGIYYKVAPLTDMFANYNINHVQVGGLRIGNPNMEPERVNSYEIGYSNQFSDEFAFSVNAYYKDIFNELGVAAVRITPSPYFQTTVSEYGNARGLEFELRKRRSNNYSFRLNYTLMNVMGTADNVNTNLGINPDRSVPGLSFFPYPLAAYPLGRDIPNNINLLLNLYFDDNDGPSIAGVYLLENFDFGLTFNYTSGSPFTVTDLNGVPRGERNADRFPSQWNANLKVRRMLDLGDVFGDSFKGNNVELYLDIFNVFNNRQAVAWNTASKDPDNNPALLATQIGQIAGINYYKEGNYADPASFNVNQYDNYGYRIYQADKSGFAPSDVDKNGIITQQEMYDATLKYYEDQLKFKGNYKIPITVFFGIKINFQSLLSN